MSMKRNFKGSSTKYRLIIFLILSLSNISLYSQESGTLKLGTIFQDHMVLQRDKPIRIWGSSKKGQQIQVTLGENSGTSQAGPDGKWVVELPALSAPGPYELMVKSGAQQLQLTDLLVGDIWIASGQSNMEWPLSGTNFREEDSLWIEKADVRLLKVHASMDYQPQSEGTNSGWQKLNIQEIQNFSAVGYHFAKQVYQQTGVPIGIISANLGATSVETWMSNEALSDFPQFPAIPKQSFKELRTAFKSGTTNWSKEVYYSGMGIENKWYENPPEKDQDWKTIQIAGNSWEEVEDLKNFDGPVWFRKKFDLPHNFVEDSLIINLLQIDDYDMTWVNGKKIGETFGKHNHRSYKVAATDLKPTNNILIVRVFDSGGIGGFTTSAFWGNDILWGDWEYLKGRSINSEKFVEPRLPNVSPFSSPGVLYNGTISPLTSLGITGVIWYQGESNELRAYEYRKLFPALIKDWRQQFDQEDFPFLFVQLANYRQEPEHPQESFWAELRESQTLALELPNVGMAVAIDLGEAGDIHPKNKEDVGKRLAKLALNMVYQKDIATENFKLRNFIVKKEKAILKFSHPEKGLVNRNKYGYIRGFQIAGYDKKFYWAQAKLQGDEVVVWSPEVQRPVAVRYAWSDNPGELDLYSSTGLPLAPFRTDTWKLSTEGEVFKEGPRF